MKSRLVLPDCRFWHSRSATTRSFTRQSSSPSSSSSSRTPPYQSRWIRLALVSVAAAGIGAYIRSQQGSPVSTTLNPVQFSPYYLVSKEPVSSTGSIFTLRPPKPDERNRAVYDEAWKTGIWSAMFKQPQLQIGRDYTPLPYLSKIEGDDTLRFFIRKDPFGEVSRYLHGLRIGDSVEIRGPRIECPIPPDTQNILFIAGGTGIAPALQAGYTLLYRTSDTYKPQIHILWANRQREDCAGGLNDTPGTPQSRRSWFPKLPQVFSARTASTLSSTPPPSSPPSILVRELEALKSQYPGQVTVDYYVDEENEFIKKDTVLEITNSASKPSELRARNLILVSGPEGFISYMAGPKLWAQGMELQGPLNGIIKEMDLKDWTVWKL